MLLARATQPGEADAALHALADRAEPACVPHLAPLAFHGPDDLRRLAAVAIDRALGTASATELVQIDDACRWGARPDSEITRAWQRLTAMHLLSLDAIGPGMQSAWVVASFHPNGYVREAAVRRLADWPLGIGIGRELGALLLRMNDWVPTVAAQAATAVERRLTLDYAAVWLPALPLLQRLGHHTRRSADTLMARIDALLCAPAARRVLREGLQSTHRNVGRDAIRLLLAAPLGTDEYVDVVTVALRSTDPVVRVQAAASVYSRISEPAIAPLVPTLLEDPYPPVRQRGLAAIAEHGRATSMESLERALLDQSAAVREIARYGLRRLGWPTPFTAFYSAALVRAEQPRVLAAAVRGLGETGGPEHGTALLELLDHPRPRIRVAVVRALATVDTAGTVQARLSRLRDVAPRVSRAARDTLRRQVLAVGVDAIRRAIRDVAHPHGRRDALALAADLPKWDSLLVLLEAAAAKDTMIRAGASDRLARWLERQNQSFAPPEPWQVAEATRLMSHGEQSLSAPMRRELGDVIDFWSR